MQYMPLKELKISRIGLGTVQFGIDYGINNTNGQVKYGEIIDILNLAKENGINFIDTSRYYGSSEDNLGRALKEIGAAEEMIVCTKLDLPDNYRELSEPELISAASESLETSREKLDLESIPVYLLHNAEFRTLKDGVLWDFLKEQRDKGIIGHLGVSIGGSPDEAEQCLRDPDVEAIQIPYNLFDYRWHKAGILAEAAEKGVAVINRSTYLQGLLLMSAGDVAAKIPEALPFIDSLEEFIRETGYNRKKMILKYVLEESGICSTIIGNDSLEQLKENISIYEEEPLSRDILEQLRNLFFDVPGSIVNPAMWGKR